MVDYKGLFSFKINTEKSIDCDNYDGILTLHWDDRKALDKKIATAIELVSACDPSLKDVTVTPLPNVPAGRVVISPVGKVDPDYDDVRCVQAATEKAIKRALAIGIKKPLIYLTSNPMFHNAELVQLLAAFEALYVPLQIRELKPSNVPSIDHLGIVIADGGIPDYLLSTAMALESGRRVARDIGEADPERMAPPKVEQYVREIFANSPIKITSIDDVAVMAKEYPLFEAVNRAASTIERHRGRIVYLEYEPKSTVKETLMFVGKGVTYDTGGADIKAGGVMAGMSRDKCGAAAVAGFMQVVAILQPPNVKVIAALSLVRNSVGSNCYVADELIKARSGALVRVGNTDAEGRMVMADVLCRMKELALNAVNPHLFTIATLTGHACIAVGNGYSIVMDNGPARKAGVSKRLQESGEIIGDPFEISTLRKEDLKFHRGQAKGDDILQACNHPSSRIARGHQGPAGFLLLASGLEEYGSGHKTPIKYSHLDIAASAGLLPSDATGSPILSLANAFLMNN